MVAKLVGRYVGTTRGVFEFGDGTTVEADGPVVFDDVAAPGMGERAILVTDADGRVLRWEPHPLGGLRGQAT
jgi:hypothetical protein